MCCEGEGEVNGFVSSEHLSTVSSPRHMIHLEKATFAGGCFWGMQKWFKKEFPKLKSTTVGYTGGTKPNPTYKVNAQILYIFFLQLLHVQQAVS
jgi:hypothetical protein